MNEVVGGLGLAKARSVFEKLKSSERSPHAILLYGPVGAGKREFCHQITEHWLGTERAVSAFRRGMNPDVFLIQPFGPSRNILVAHMVKPQPEHKEIKVHLSDFTPTPPLYSNHKVVIIEDADRMNDAACNALLKPLEEPHPFVRYILTTSVLSRIRPTILSRCLAVNCELPTPDEISQHFPTLHHGLRALGEGSPGRLAEIEKNPELYQQVLDLADLIATGSAIDVLYLSERTKELSDAFSQLTPKESKRTINANVLEMLAISLSRLHPNQVHALQVIIDAHRKVIGNANSVLVFDHIYAQILIR